MPDQKKQESPWLGKKDAADLPDEVAAQMFDADGRRLERAIVNAQFIQTQVPPQAQWRTCWSCGEKTPIRFRDVVFQILVCRKCLLVSLQHAGYERMMELSALLGGMPHDADEEEEDEGDIGDENEEVEATDTPDQPPEAGEKGENEETA